MSGRRVLITYGWCRTAYVALRALARTGHVVYVCGSNAPLMCAWSRHCCGSAVVADPFTAPEQFTRDLVALVERWRIDVVLPGHEDGLVLRRHQDLLPEGVTLACPEQVVYQNAVDKAWITRLAMESGVTVPETRFPVSTEEAVAEAEELGYPLVVKLRGSNSGKGVVAVDGPEDLEKLLNGKFARFAARPDRFPLLQRRIDGSVVGACFLAREGGVVSMFLERYLRCKDGEFGTSVFREPLQCDLVSSSATRMVAALNWTGIGHFDFLIDRHSGVPHFLEMNPRLWGALNLAFVNGYDFLSALVDQETGEPELGRHFQPLAMPGLRSLWCVGEAIAMVNRFRGGQWRQMGGVLTSTTRSLFRLRFDDFVWSDPLPLLAEAWCYGRLFLRSGGATNPDVEGMLS